MTYYELTITTIEKISYFLNNQTNEFEMNCKQEMLPLSYLKKKKL